MHRRSRVDPVSPRRTVCVECLAEPFCQALGMPAICITCLCCICDKCDPKTAVAPAVDGGGKPIAAEDAPPAMEMADRS